MGSKSTPMRLPRYLLFLLLSTGLTACFTEPDLAPLPAQTTGLAPLYAADGDWQRIERQAPQAITQLGKLYYKDGYLFATEIGQGIHVFDNTDPESPEKIAFLRIPGCSELSIKGQVLYANNVTDLVSLDLSNPAVLPLLDRQRDVFKRAGGLFPEDYRGFFECADPARGTVLAWYETELSNPQCQR